MTPELTAALAQLEAALLIEGRKPRYHREVMVKHRAEWPTLWAAIDAIRLASKEPVKPGQTEATWGW